MEQIKWPEGVFPQQRWQGCVQRDYCESFMTDLITPSWLLCEILTPKEHGRCDSYQNLFIVHPLQIMGKYQDSVKGTSNQQKPVVAMHPGLTLKLLHIALNRDESVVIELAH